MSFNTQTKTVHHDRVILPDGNLPLVSPIHQSVKYVPRNVSHLRQILADRHQGFMYSRVSNPTVRELEILLAKLQGRQDAICTASGIAALATAAVAILKAQDQVVMFRESYKPTRFLLSRLLGNLGVQTTILGIDDTEELKKLVLTGRVKALFLESPTNPMLRVPDLEQITRICRSTETLTILDNTFAGFLHHGSFDFDLFVHSLTKHACGHSDVMGGVVIGNTDIINQLAPTAITLGATLDPHAAWLIQRGMKTYSLRTKAASSNAQEIAEWLNQRHGVKNVRYPSLASHPDKKIWAKQMNGDGGSVIAFDIDGTQNLMDQFIDQLNIFALTPSMGCVESLVAPCLCLFADDLSLTDAAAAGIGPSTVRLAVGIENISDLIEDIDQSLRLCGFAP